MYGFVAPGSALLVADRIRDRLASTAGTAASSEQNAREQEIRTPTPRRPSRSPCGGSGSQRSLLKESDDEPQPTMKRPSAGPGVTGRGRARGRARGRGRSLHDKAPAPTPGDEPEEKEEEEEEDQEEEEEPSVRKKPAASRKRKNFDNEGIHKPESVMKKPAASRKPTPKLKPEAKGKTRLPAKVVSTREVNGWKAMLL